MMYIYQGIYIQKLFFQMWFPILLLRSLDLFILYTIVVNFCQFSLTLSRNLCIHLFFKTCNLIKDRIWTIFKSSVLKDSIYVFLLYHTFKFTWSATGPWPVGDQLHQVAKRSQRGRQPVTDQLQNLVATPLRPLRWLWILVAERS